MNSRRVALQLKSLALSKGGVTVDSFGNDASDFPGYIVGGKVPSLVHGDVSHVQEFVQNNPSDFYGSWLDQETALIHYDAVDLIADKFEAIRLGVRRGELAVWDGKAGEEIRLPEPHKYDPECVCIACEAVRMEDWEYDPDCNCETCKTHREGGEQDADGPGPDEWAGHYDESGY